MKLLILLILACGMFLSLACNAFYYEDPNRTMYPPPIPQTPIDEVLRPTADMDLDLTRQIQAMLKRGIYGKTFEDVTVYVSGGNVTLSGNVRLQRDKTDIEQKVRQVGGVGQIDNRILVTGGGY